MTHLCASPLSEGVRQLLPVATIADLTELTAPTETVSIQVLGYYAKGDGGGGPVRHYDTASTATPTGGSVLIPDSIVHPAPGRWLWGWSGPINPLWFGVKMDGTDYTDEFENAKGYCAGLGAGAVLEFPAGTFGFSEITPNFGLYFNNAFTLRGAGVEKTTLKNLSATGAGIRCASGYINMSGFTLDQNNSTGVGFRQGGQYSKSSDLLIKNQAGANYALVVDGSTLADLENIVLANCSNGLDIGPTLPTNYVNFRQVTIEQTSGKAFRANTAANCRFFGLYIEPKDTATNFEKFAYLTGCSELDFFGFGTEPGGAHILTDSAYFEINNSRSINFYGGRINHEGTAAKAIFELTGTTCGNINFDGQEMQSTKTGMSLYKASGAVAGLSVKNIRTSLTSTAVGLNLAAACTKLSAENWTDGNAACTHVIDAIDAYVANVEGNIAVTQRDRQTFVNCGGTFSGTGANTCVRINSNGAESGAVRKKLVTVTRDLTAATGSVATTGIGFKPKSLRIIATVDGAANIFSEGFVAGAEVRCIALAPTATPSWNLIPTKCVYIQKDAAGSDYQNATIDSLDSDGFTLSWIKGGTPTGTATLYIEASQ